METYSLAVITQKLHQSGILLFTIKSLRDILNVKKESSFFSLLSRLIQNRVLLKLERGKYVLAGKNISDFSLANFLYSPSYVSLESALNFHGILSQFPYEIVSVTSKKPVKKIIFNKTFSYIHIQNNLFWGYEKKNGFLIAVPEKALLDQLYFAAKGLRGVSLDEYDFSLINIAKAESYLKRFPSTRQLNKMVISLRQYWKK